MGGMDMRLKYLNKRMTSNNFGDFDVIGHENGKYRIRFVDTGYEYSVDTSNLSKGNVYDPYKPSYYGIGYLGEMAGHAKGHPMLSTWEKILERCYKNHFNYHLGLLCEEWKDFSKFCKDVEQLPFYDRRLAEGGKKWNLDKDVLGGGTYCKEHCMWIPQDMNVQVAGVYDMINMGFKIEYPDKETIIKYINEKY